MKRAHLPGNQVPTLTQGQIECYVQDFSSCCVVLGAWGFADNGSHSDDGDRACDDGDKACDDSVMVDTSRVCQTCTRFWALHGLSHLNLITTLPREYDCHFHFHMRKLRLRNIGITSLRTVPLLRSSWLTPSMTLKSFFFLKGGEGQGLDIWVSWGCSSLFLGLGGVISLH